MKARSIVALFVLALLGVLAMACGAAGAEVKVDKGLAAVAGANAASAQRASGQGEEAVAPAALVDKVSIPGSVPATGGSVTTGGGVPAMAREMSAYSPDTGASLAPLEQVAAMGIIVQGFGRATAPADTARIQFVVSKSGDMYAEPVPAKPEVAPGGNVEGEAVTPTPPEVYPYVSPTPSAVTDADLQPLVDAIKAQGVSDSDIQVTTYPSSYNGPYGSPTARVTVTLRDPKRTGELIDAGNQAVAESGTLYIQNVGVIYNVNSCDTLLKEARKAAVEDARANGAGLAEALGVGLGNIQGASEYYYDPYGYSSCQPQSAMPYYEYEGPSFDPAQAAEVQIVSNVTISFAMS